MKIAFIHPPFHHRKFSENLKVVDEEFTLSPPIILAYIAAAAERAGHESLLVDAHVLALSKEETLARIGLFKPDILAFRLDTYSFQETLAWIQYFKISTGLPVAAGGINFSLYPIETMAHREIDFGFIGDAVRTFPQFLDCMQQTQQYAAIPGLCWRSGNGELHINPVANERVPFDAYPLPARHLLPNERYHSFVSKKKNFTIMLTSTGCPFTCSFCAIGSQKHYNERSWESVIHEIEECYHRYGVREIDFFDATFFVNKERSLRIFKEMQKRKLALTWTCRSRVDVVDEELLREAARAGCRMIFWGIESGAQNILNAVRKGITPLQVHSAIKLARTQGIKNLGFLMIGNPGETEEDIRQTVRFAKRLGLDYVQICRTIAKPGTPLHKELVALTGADYWRDFVLGKAEEERIPTPWVGINQEKLENLLKWAYYSFFFRPRFILKTMLSIRSFEEAARYCKVGIRMLFHYFHTDIELAQHAPIIKRIAHWKLHSETTHEEASHKKAAVIIPTFNEKSNIIELVEKLMAFYAGIRVIVVDSDSVDGTPAAVQQLSRFYPSVQLVRGDAYTGFNQRGAAIKKGWAYALNQGAEVIVEMDADLSHDPKNIGELLHWAQSFDVVIGSRYVKGGGIIGRNLLRNALSVIANGFVRRVLGLHAVVDCTSGFRCYTKSALMALDIRQIQCSEGTSALIETLVRAHHLGLRIKEVPIMFEERKRGDSKFNAAVIVRSMQTVFALKG